MKTVRVGVLGCGYWGPNHIRILSSMRAENVQMAVAADQERSMAQPFSTAESRPKNVGARSHGPSAVAEASEEYVDAQSV